MADSVMKDAKMDAGTLIEAKRTAAAAADESRALSRPSDCSALFPCQKLAGKNILLSWTYRVKMA